MNSGYFWLLILLTCTSFVVELLRERYESQYERSIYFVAHLISLIIALLCDVRWGKYKAVVVLSSLLTMHAVVLVSIYTIADNTLAKEIIKLSFEVLWAPMTTLMLGLSLDQIKIIKVRYKLVLCTATFAHFLWILTPTAAFILTHYKLYWVQKDLYFLEYMPLIVAYTSMLLYLIIFGFNLRIVNAPQHNPIRKMIKCYQYARIHYFRQEVYNTSFMDFAAGRYGERVANDVKRCLALLILFPLLCVSFTSITTVELWHQLSLKTYPILVDEANFPLLLAGIQLFTVPFSLLTIILFSVTNIWFINTNLRKMIAGAIILFFTIIFNMVIAKEVASIDIALPGERTGHLILYNTLNCDMTISIPVISHYDFEIESLHHLHLENFTFRGELKTTYSYTCGSMQENNTYLIVDEKKVFAYYFTNDKAIGFEDDIQRDPADKPKLRILANLKNHKTLQFRCHFSFMTAETNSREQLTLNNEDCEVFADNMDLLKIDMSSGGVYALLMCENDDGKIRTRMVILTPPGNVSSLYIVFHMFFVEFGRTLYNVYGLTWIYVEAPTRLKMFFLQFFMRLSAVGSVFVYIIEEFILKEHSDVLKLSCTLGLSAFGLGCCIILTMFYNYPDLELDKDEYSDDESENVRELRRRHQEQQRAQQRAQQRQ